MDFELTEFQTDLAEGVRRLCQGRFPLETLRAVEGSEQVVDKKGWRELGEAGVFNLCLAESAGGVGLGLPEAVLVFEELGRALVPGPLVATHLAAGLVDGAADGAAVVGLVERPVPGAAIPLVVEYLSDLDTLLVLSDEGVAAVDPATLDATAVHRPMDPLTPLWIVTALPEGTPLGGSELSTRWRRDGALLTAALQVGSAGWSTDLATAYAEQRHSSAGHRRLPSDQAHLRRHVGPDRGRPGRRAGRRVTIVTRRRRRLRCCTRSQASGRRRPRWRTASRAFRSTAAWGPHGSTGHLAFKRRPGAGRSVRHRRRAAAEWLQRLTGQVTAMRRPRGGSRIEGSRLDRSFGAVIDFDLRHPLDLTKRRSCKNCSARVTSALSRTGHLTEIRSSRRVPRTRAPRRYRWVSNVRENGLYPRVRSSSIPTSSSPPEPSLGLCLYAVEVRPRPPTSFADAVRAAGRLPSEPRAHVQGRGPQCIRSRSTR